MPKSLHTVSAFDAKNRFGKLLDRVQAGEVLTITRHGQPIAQLIPINEGHENQTREALEMIRKVRDAMIASGRKVTREEVRKWKAEGRR